MVLVGSEPEPKGIQYTIGPLGSGGCIKGGGVLSTWGVKMGSKYPKMGVKVAILPPKKGVFDLFWGYFPPVVGPRNPVLGGKIPCFGG